MKMSGLAQIVLVLVISACISCGNNGNNVKNERQSQSYKKNDFNNKEFVNNLLDSAIIGKDEKAYSKASTLYFLANSSNDFFYYAFIMALQNNSSEGYFNLYEIIAYSSFHAPNETFKNMHPKIKSFAFYSLLKSHEMGNERAIHEIAAHFDTTRVLPSAESFLKVVFK